MAERDSKMNDVVQLPEKSTEPSARKLRHLFPSVQRAEAEREGIDLRATLSVLWRRKGLILGCAAVIMGLATTYIHQLTPLYTAQASLMLDQQKLQLIDIKSVLSGAQDSSAVVATQVEVLTSPAIANKAAAKLHLESIPEFNPALRPPSSFSPIAWLGEKISAILPTASDQPTVQIPQAP